MELLIAPASEDRSSPHHVPALDGLRGIAVLGVVAFHAHGALPGGYLGVDLFFVLSGYLITGILLREHRATGAIALRGFWGRRARRLLPALLALMPAVALYARLVAKPEEVAALRADALATLGYVANWRAIYARKSYWEIFAAPSPLEHTWSLAIEEQFYVVWPLLVGAVLPRERCAAARWRRALRALLALCLVGAALSMALMAWSWTPEHGSRAYMGSDTRAAAILLGAALATWLPIDAQLSSSASRVLDRGGLAAAAVLAIAWAKLDGQSALLYRGGLWITELAALVLIACAVAVPRGIIARALSFRLLVALGTISYGIYLWHWPVDVVLTPERLHVRPLAVDLLRGLVTLTIALVSYRFIERPIRRRGISFAPPIVVVPASFGLAAALVVLATRARPLPPPPIVTAAPPTAGPDARSVKKDALPAAAELPPGTLRVLVLGDSVAQYLGDAMRLEQSTAATFVAQRGVGACSIHDAEPTWIDGKRVEGTSCASSWAADVAELRPDVTLIVLGGGFLGWRTCQREWRKDYADRLVFLLRGMGAPAGRIVIARVPYPGERWRYSDMMARVDCFNEELERVARVEGKAMLDLMGHVCPTKDCISISDGWPVRNDGLHFDGPGASETAAWTLAELRRIVATPPPF